MSTVKANNVQVGQSGTATNNFTLYQPSTPDGTVRLAVGNSGATSADVLTANSSGNVGIGTSSPAVKLDISETSSGAVVTQAFLRNPAALAANTAVRLSMSAVNTANRFAYIQAGVTGASDNGHYLAFGTNELGTGPVERARFNATGAFVLAGGTTTANGIGITFPATQSASSDANTLDDYEEGTFTYTLPCSTSGSYTVRSGYSTGFYTKIGRLVTVNIRYETQGSSSPVGNLQLAGLPFARASDPSGGVSQSVPSILFRGSTGTIASFYVNLNAGATTVTFHKQLTDGTYSNMAVADVSGGSGGGFEGAICITYET